MKLLHVVVKVDSSSLSSRSSRKIFGTKGFVSVQKRSINIIFLADGKIPAASVRLAVTSEAGLRSRGKLPRTPQLARHKCAAETPTNKNSNPFWWKRRLLHMNLRLTEGSLSFQLVSFWVYFFYSPSLLGLPVCVCVCAPPATHYHSGFWLILPLILCYRRT